MKIRKSFLMGTVSVLAFMAGADSGFAQEAPKATDISKQPTEEIIVTGIRRSLQQSLEIKRTADTVLEAISAEDIGKLPDKNVADALQRIPGVNTSSAAGGEGGFDENDRVSIRGTSPSLTQTMINGHSVASGDWFLLDQFQTVGRSVSYALLPSELVSKVLVYKSQQADLVEGGVAGSVDIQTRKPLDFAKELTAEGQIQGVYADLPGKSDFQGNGMVNWKNADNTFGVLLQGFYEERHVRRDGQEFLGYTTIAPTSPAAVAHPNLSNVVVPTFIGSALFEQTRKRAGGDADIELRPSDSLSFDLNGFYSHLDADNYNRNFLAWTGNLANKLVPTSYTVKNGTLVAANFPNQSATPSVLIDDISRPGAASETYYVNLDGKYQPSDTLTITGAVGYTHGVGSTPSQPAYEGQMFSGLNFDMSSGLNAPASVSLPGINPSNFAGVSTSWSWNEVIQAIDEETYVQADGKFTVDKGVFDSVKFGARYSDHKRTVDFPLDGGCLSSCFSTVPTWNGGVYPSDFGQGLAAPSGFLAQAWQLDPAAIASYVAAHVSSGPSRRYWPGEMNVEEQDTAGYIMAFIGGDGWKGNFGLRIVNTHESSIVNVSGGANPITTSAFGPFTPTKITHDYLDFLPSLNLKFDLEDDLVLRAAAARTMARPDYSALGGAVSLTDNLLTGTGGNPNLKPIRSSNYDATLEWYFGPQSLLSAGIFYMDLSSYVTFSVAPAVYFDQLTGNFQTYQITSPSNIGGESKGFEVAYEQPIWNGFGVTANYTYADSTASDGSPLVGSSKHTYNIGGYYENDRLSARVAYTFRSHFMVGLDRSFAENEDDIGSLDASVNVVLTDNVALTFDALNLSNETLKYYANTKDQPRAFYSNGRQFYAGARLKF